MYACMYTYMSTGAIGGCYVNSLETGCLAEPGAFLFDLLSQAGS